jgi:hypothetical protein
MAKVFWALAAIGATVGAAEFVAIVTAREISAPQQAAGAAMACAWAIIPYVIARAISEIGKQPSSQAAAQSHPPSEPR